MGRTGGGKSTIFNVLLRTVDEVTGVVEIGGTDSNLISKQELRNRIAIIPQDPILLKGTWRYNLAPNASAEFGVEEDARMWDALNRVQESSKAR